MAKHKSICWIVTILVFIGALNWGLVGLGTLIKADLNVVNLLVGSLPYVEQIIYLLIGIAGLVFGYVALKCKDCTCTKK